MAYLVKVKSFSTNDDRCQQRWVVVVGGVAIGVGSSGWTSYKMIDYGVYKTINSKVLTRTSYIQPGFQQRIKDLIVLSKKYSVDVSSNEIVGLLRKYDRLPREIFPYKLISKPQG